MFTRLLLESFLRQRRRKLLAGIAILLGTTAVTAMLALATTIGDRIHQELAVYGANIVIYPKTDLLDVKIGGVDVKPATGGSYLKESDLPKLRTIFWGNNINGVSPELPVTQPYQAIVSGKGPVPVHLVGMWFDHDLAGLKTGAPKLHAWWKLNGQWPKADAQGMIPAVLGVKIAHQLGITTGAPFAFTGPDGIEKQAEVSGILMSGDETDNEILIPLSTAQNLNGTPGAVRRVEVAATTKPEDPFARKDPDTLSPALREIWYCRPYANSIAYQIREAIPDAQAEQVRRVEQSEGTVLRRISGLMWFISAAALLAAGFAVSAAMATAILERRGEIGLMRSLGASKGSIALLFYAETALLAIVAGSLGYLLGSGLAAWLGGHIFAGDTLSRGEALNLVLLPVVVGIALIVAAAGSTPSIRAALEMEPAAVLRADA